jgi:hypothetical protein
MEGKEEEAEGKEEEEEEKKEEVASVLPSAAVEFLVRISGIPCSNINPKTSQSV